MLYTLLLRDNRYKVLLHQHGHQQPYCAFIKATGEGIDQFVHRCRGAVGQLFENGFHRAREAASAAAAHDVHRTVAVVGDDQVRRVQLDDKVPSSKAVLQASRSKEG